MNPRKTHNGVHIGFSCVCLRMQRSSGEAGKNCSILRTVAQFSESPPCPEMADVVAADGPHCVGDDGALRGHCGTFRTVLRKGLEAGGY
jgi:hypothetical protein